MRRLVLLTITSSTSITSPCPMMLSSLLTGVASIKNLSHFEKQDVDENKLNHPYWNDDTYLPYLFGGDEGEWGGDCVDNIPDDDTKMLKSELAS